MTDDREYSGSFELPTPRVVLHEDVLGQRRTFAGLGIIEWIFLFVSRVNIFVAIGLTVARLILTRNDPESFDFTYSLLLLISALFCVFYVFNGVLRERQYEIYAFVGAVLLVLIYCILDYALNPSGRSFIKLVRLCFGSVLAPLNIGLAIVVARQFGWLEFRIVGASEALQQMYRQLCFFLSLQRFDLQAAASFLILVLKNGSGQLDLEEKVTLGIGVPILIICFALGFYAVLREIKGLVYLLVFLSLIEPTYVIYKLIVVYTLNSELDFCRSSVTNNYSSIQSYDACIHVYTTLGVGGLAFLVRCMLLYELYVVCLNFGNGLTERAFASLVDSERTSLLGRDRRRRHN